MRLGMRSNIMVVAHMKETPPEAECPAHEAIAEDLPKLPSDLLSLSLNSRTATSNSGTTLTCNVTTCSVLVVLVQVTLELTTRGASLSGAYKRIVSSAVQGRRAVIFHCRTELRNWSKSFIPFARLRSCSKRTALRSR